MESTESEKQPAICKRFTALTNNPELNAKIEARRIRYSELQQQKAALELKIPTITDDAAASLLRSDYRKIINQLETILVENLEDTLKK